LERKKEEEGKKEEKQTTQSLSDLSKMHNSGYNNHDNCRTWIV
jgi:hypothetical protein